MPTYFLSGAIFPLTNLPRVMEIITKIDPLTYGVDGLRGALIASNHFALHVDVLILAGLSLILLGIGSYLFSLIEI